MKVKSRQASLKQGVPPDPIIGLVDHILHTAVVRSASDIHLEPTDARMRLRYRIDGILYDQPSIALIQGEAVLSRLKVLSSLDIAQRRLPQDGKIVISFIADADDHDRLIDLRISTFPTIFGEKMVVRILDRHGKIFSLEALGCTAGVLQAIETIIDRPHGFFLVTGPTGSGKTTTLYALLAKLNSPERHIITMEDPVEYHIAGITQSQINLKSNFTFERGLRALLRQDPDVAMVGEIRDRQTAQIAIEAALTGHLVLSTLHTNDSVGAITRLIDQGIEPFLLTSSLTAVLAQRLVRRLCVLCKYESVLTEQERLFAKKYQLTIQTTWRAKGCDHCLHVGYKGRIGLFELLVIDRKIRRLIMQGADHQQIHEQALRNGMEVLLDDALEKVCRGLISLREVVRLVGPS